MNIIMQHSHINYPPSYEIIRDGRILNALVKRGLINEWDKKYKYVNDYEFCCNYTEYNNNKYVVMYFDGCFSPFVCKVNNNNLSDEGGANVK